MRIVSPAEGRFQRFGKWAEYDEWLEDEGSAARRLNRSAANDIDGRRRDQGVTVVVHNWSDDRPERGRSASTLPRRHDRRRGDASPTARWPPGAEETMSFAVSNSYTNATLPGAGGRRPVQRPTSRSRSRRPTRRPPAIGSENLTMSIVPKTSIPAAASAPTLDGAEGAGEYTGEALDVGRKWEPGGSTRNCSPQGVDCGSSSAPGTAGSTYAKVTRNGDDLYFLVHVKDDFQSYAVTPAECVAHWQADSVELLIDPRGTAPDAQPRHGGHVQARRLPVHQRPVQHATATAPTARAGRATPTTTRATPPARSRARSPTPRTPPACRSRRTPRGSAPTTRASTTATPAAATRSRSRSRWPTSRPPWTRTRWA